MKLADLFREVREAEHTAAVPSRASSDPDFLNADLGSAANAEVSGVTCDSRQVRPGFVFVALRGLHADGTSFGRDAVKRGAVQGSRLLRFQ